MQEEVKTLPTNDTSAVVDRAGEAHGALPPGNYILTRNSRLGRLDQEAQAVVGRFRTLMPSFLYPEIRKAPCSAKGVHSDCFRVARGTLHTLLRSPH